MKNIREKITELERLWNKFDIPEGICNIYRDLISSVSRAKLEVFLHNEIEGFGRESALILICLNTILSREESLKSIKSLNLNLSLVEDWEYIDEVKLECAEILTNYRLLTLDLVDYIFEWRTQLENYLGNGNMDIEFEGQRYLHKIKQDLMFLYQSELTKVFKFSETSDPFIIKYAKVGYYNKCCIIKDQKVTLLVSQEIYEKAVLFTRIIENDPGTSGDLPRVKSTEFYIRRQEVAVQTIAKKEPGKNNIISIGLRKKKYFLSDLESPNRILNNNYSVSNKNLLLPQLKTPNTKKYSIPSFTPNVLTKKKIQPIVPRIKLKRKTEKIVEPNKKFQPVSVKARLRTPTESIKREQNDINCFVNIENMVHDAIISENVLENIIENVLDCVYEYVTEIKEEIERQVASKHAGRSKETVPNEDKQEKIAENDKNSFEVELNDADRVSLYKKKPGPSTIKNKTDIKDKLKNHIKNKIGGDLLTASNTLPKSLDFISPEEPVSEDFTLIPLSEYEDEIGKILEIYYKALTKISQAYTTEAGLLLSSSKKHLNPCWYWYRGSKIGGLLVYSTSLSHTKNHCIVHHISCIQPDLFQDFLSKFQEVLVQSDFSSIEFPLIPLDYEKIIKLQPIRLQSEAIRNHLKIKSTCKLTTSNTDQVFSPRLDQNIFQAGNWNCLITELQRIGYKPLKDSEIRLQKEVTEVYEMISACSNFSYPFPGSCFDINITMPFSYINDGDRSCICFYNTETQHNDQYTIYFIPCTLTDYKIFFVSSACLIEDLRQEADETDLFYKVEIVLKEVYEKTVTECLLVPVFNINNKWEVSWAKGMNIDAETYVNNCIETLSIHFQLPQKATASLNHKNAISVTEDFIFGVIHEDVYRILEIPMLVALIHTNS
jgi:hypothetical protein